MFSTRLYVAAVVGIFMQWLTGVVAPTVEECQDRIKCCERHIRREAEETCLEYAKFGFTIITCRQWTEAIVQSCKQNCASCDSMWNSLQGQCLFFLSVAGVAPSARVQMCGESATIMKEQRCPSACDLEDLMCQTDEAVACLQQCSNYQKCYCRVQKGTLQPDICVGRTVLNGPLEDNPDMIHNCNNTPADCRNHRLESTCAKYKWCPIDMCLVKAIVCKSDNYCRNLGTCDKTTGWCSYEAREDGEMCDDGYSYTSNDMCLDGECVGTVDFCAKENITCLPPNECYDVGQCMPHTGRCIHRHRVDGTVCNDGLDYTFEDKCQNGLCVGQALNSCVDKDVKCGPLDQCHLPGICDRKTGLCDNPIVPTKMALACDDGDPNTWGDMCIDGVCIGNAWKDPQFQLLGGGECIDLNGQQMASYSGDVKDESMCRRYCYEDTQCAGYSYSFPVCRLYGTVRNKAPPGNRWAFVPGDERHAFSIELATGEMPGGRPVNCWKKAAKANELHDEGPLKVNVDDVFRPVDLAFLFFVAMLCATGPCLYRTFCKRGCAKVASVSPERTTSHASVKQENGVASGEMLPRSDPQDAHDLRTDMGSRRVDSRSEATQRRGGSLAERYSEGNVVERRSSSVSERNVPAMPPPLLRPQAPLPLEPPPAAQPSPVITRGKVPPRQMTRPPKTLAVPEPELPSSPDKK